jgi:hypothetical protein
MNRQLLVETHYLTINPKMLNESVSSEGNVIVEGVLATAEVKNGKGRYYSRRLWERELSKYQDLIRDRRSMGELDHPDSQQINLKNVSHIVVGFRWDGNNVIGRIEILPTPSGNILKALILNGVKVAVSSRGMGSLEDKDGVLEVQDDFGLLCWDFVSTPSNENSYMHVIKEGLMSKTYDYSRVNSLLTEILCSKGSCPMC